MRIPVWIRCAWLRFQLREERSRLAELLECEGGAQYTYAHTGHLARKAAAAELVAEFARRIAATRSRISALRKSIARLRSGLPERLPGGGA